MAKVDLYPDFREFFGLLNRHRVKYLLIGGYAVNHYGYHRSTSDLDIWIAVSPRNATRVAQVLREFAGFSATEVYPAMFGKMGRMFVFGREPARIDLITDPSALEFEACYKARQTIEWDGVKVPVIAFSDLVRNKAATGRSKDQADIANLPPLKEGSRPTAIESTTRQKAKKKRRKQ